MPMTMNSQTPLTLPPTSKNGPTALSKKNTRYPSKTCKYAGVTFRASRDKYQARIYKGNKEYNLGLFDVAADAALAYDMAHRLVKKVTSEPGKEKETLDAYEADKSAPDWLECGEDDDSIAKANAGLDPEKLNFLSPLNLKTEREKELSESELAATPKHRNCPKLEKIRVVVRKEAIRVVKIIIGASDGGTNNYRKKGKKARGTQDGSLGNPSKKQRKKKSNSGKGASGAKSPLDPAATLQNNEAVASAWVARDDAYTGLPSRASAGVSLGPMARNREMMRHMAGNGTHKAMMEGPNEFINNSSNAIHMMKSSNDNSIVTDKHELLNDKPGGVDNNSTFSQDTHQAGNVSAKMPGDLDPHSMGNPFGTGGNNSSASGSRNEMGAFSNAHNNQDGFNPMQSSDNYSALFKNMRNYFQPGAMGGQNMMYGGMSEEYQRMMLARAMGHNSGHNPMHGNAAGMSSMMGMDNRSSLSQGNPYSNGFGDQQNDNKELENLKSMVQNDIDRSMMDRSMLQGGMDKQPGAVNHDKTSNQNVQSISPSTLNMFRTGGFPSSQTNQNSHSAMRAEQLCLETGMYNNGDRFSHGALPGGSQYGQGHNPSSLGNFSGRGEGGPSSLEQQSFFQTFGQSNFSSSNASAGATGYNPAYDDMAQLLGMPGSSHPQSKSQGNNRNSGPL